jgi:hypothetical protein
LWDFGSQYYLFLSYTFCNSVKHFMLHCNNWSPCVSKLFCCFIQSINRNLKQRLLSIQRSRSRFPSLLFPWHHIQDRASHLCAGRRNASRSYLVDPRAVWCLWKLGRCGECDVSKK